MGRSTAGLTNPIFGCCSEKVFIRHTSVGAMPTRSSYTNATLLYGPSPVGGSLLHHPYVAFYYVLVVCGGSILIRNNKKARERHARLTRAPRKLPLQLWMHHTNRDAICAIAGTTKAELVAAPDNQKSTPASDQNLLCYGSTFSLLNHPSYGPLNSVSSASFFLTIFPPAYSMFACAVFHT